MRANTGTQRCSGGNDGYARWSIRRAALVLAAVVLLTAAGLGAAPADTLLADDFETGITGWTLGGTPDWYSGPPANGTHSVRLRKDESIERAAPTAGYVDVSVSFSLGADNLRGRNQAVRALWYDGSAWTVLAEIRNGDAEEDGALHPFSFALPPRASDNANFRLRFEIAAQSANNYGYVDDVALTAVPLPVGRPEADFSGSVTAGLAPLEVSFTDLSIGSPDAWEWDFGDGGSSLEQHPTYVYEDPGLYTIALVASNAYGSDAEVKADYVLVGDPEAQETIFADDFEAGLGSWQTAGRVDWNGGDPGHDQYSAALRATAAMDSTISTVGYRAVVVSFYLGAKVNSVGEAVQAWWYDGLAWTMLAEIVEGDPLEDGQLHHFEFLLPEEADDNPSFALSFRTTGSNNGDFGYVDDVMVSGEPILRTLSLAADGQGTVLVDGIERSLPWTGELPHGSLISLQAVPGACAVFAGWSGDLTGSENPATVTMDDDRSVTAAFSIAEHTLTVSAAGGGSVRVEGEEKALPWSGSFACGSIVTVEAVADSGWQFDGWSGDLSGGGNPTSVTMDTDKAVTAGFSEVQHELSLTGVGNGSVKVNGTLQSLPWSGQFVYGTDVALEAEPDSGWEFDGWSGDVTWSNASVTVTMDGDKDVVATFTEIPTYTLGIAADGDGSVSVDGASVNLPWSAEFAAGTEVTLQAGPESGWEFDGWSGDVSWSGASLTLTMDGDKNLVATFSEIPSHMLSLAGDGQGSVHVDGALVDLPWSAEFAAGAEVALQAGPESGWEFGGWSGGVSWSSASLTLTMDGDKDLVASFSEIPTQTLSLAGEGEGSVTVDGAPVELPWSDEFPVGADVTLEAAPDSGWEFGGWSGDVSWSSPTLALTMDSDKSLVASFAEATSFRLSVSKRGSGTVSVDGAQVSLPWSGALPAGSEVLLSAAPAAGWEFVGWSGDAATTENPLSLVLDEEMAVEAVFERIQYELSLTSEGCGAIEVNGTPRELPWSGELAHGTEVTLRAVPAPGWQFCGWSGDAAGAEDTIAVLVDEDLSIGAQFADATTYLLTVKKVGLGAVEVNGVRQRMPWSGEFSVEAEVILRAVVQGDEEFLEWSGAVSGDENPLTVVMDVEKTVTANFACPDGLFPDVPLDHWAADAIYTARDAGIVQGYPDGYYRPTLPVNRAAMAVYLARSLSGGVGGIPDGPAEATFPDVSPDHWAYEAVEYAVAGGIAEGYGDGQYHPEWDITRGQMAVFVARSIAEPMGEEGIQEFEPPSTPTFGDVPDMQWCYRHVEYLAAGNVVAGYPDGLYRPTSTVTRDQMAVYVARAFGLLD